MTEKDLIKEFQSWGKRWLKGEKIENFGVVDEKGETKVINFTPSQKKFVNAKAQIVLGIGGMGAGKTSALNIKAFLLGMFFPRNFILVVKKYFRDALRSFLPEFFSLFPQNFFQVKRGGEEIIFPNGSQMLLMGLDALQSPSRAERERGIQRVKNLPSLGAVVIDQVEEIDERVFRMLRAKLRKKEVPFRQIVCTANPVDFWGYEYFVERPSVKKLVVHFSTEENKHNLPEEFVQDLLDNDENFVRRFFFGEWKRELFLEKRVFEGKHLEKQKVFLKKPVEVVNGIKIFVRAHPSHQYYIGIDPSEGFYDPSAIEVIDVQTGEEVATFCDFVSPKALLEKTLKVIDLYTTFCPPFLIPEARGGGTALIEGLRDKGFHRIYERESYSYVEKKKTKKLGFAITYATKKLLIQKTEDLLRKNYLKIRDPETLKQMENFKYKDEAKRSGAAAPVGQHDDRVFALMLALFPLNIGDIIKEEVDNIQKLIQNELKKVSKERSFKKIYLGWK